MNNRYTIQIIDNETGLPFMKPVECNGFVIAGCVGPVEKYTALRVRVHHMTLNDAENALYSNEWLRRAAYKMAADMPPRKLTFWKRLFCRKRS